MKNKHTPGQWVMENPDNRKANFVIYTTEKPEGLANVYPGEEAEANARLIAHAPELLQMVYDLKQAVKKLSQDDLTQFDRDTEAQIEGEAHELLTKINPDYYSNTNKNTVHH